MLATLVRKRQAPAAGELTHAGSLLGDCVRDDAGERCFTPRCIPEHIGRWASMSLRGGQAVIPGTGFLEIARAALAHRVRKPANRNSRPRIPATFRCRA